MRRARRLPPGTLALVLAAAAQAAPPDARFAGDHVEVDKTRQVMLDVHGGAVVRVVHASTGATGNTPLGRWQVYRKVPGFDWVLYDAHPYGTTVLVYA